MAETNLPPAHRTVLGPDCRVTGELVLDNDAVLMGRFEGTLRVSGTLELTDAADVSGTLIVGKLRSAGRADGEIVAEHGIELLPGGHVTGKVFTARVDVAEGANFDGDLCVGADALERTRETPAKPTLRVTEDAPSPTPASSPKNHILGRRRPPALSKLAAGAEAHPV